MSLTEFWICVQAKYIEISEKGMKMQIPFVTYYLSETGFSAVVAMKCRYLSQILCNMK
jgi:hypothetical protein